MVYVNLQNIQLKIKIKSFNFYLIDFKMFSGFLSEILFCRPKLKKKKKRIKIIY